MRGILYGIGVGVGETVSFLTIGDPAVYSTFSCIAEIARKEGIEVRTISGINSFCASASRLILYPSH